MARRDMVLYQLNCFGAADAELLYVCVFVCVRRATCLGDDDFLFEDFHGVVLPAGLLPDQNDLPERPLPQQLQVVEVAHRLEEEKNPRADPTRPRTEIIPCHVLSADVRAKR